MLPRAAIHSAAARAWAWFAGAARFAAQIGVVFALAAAGFGMTQLGCKNAAITYAKAKWPEASCTAIETHAYFSKGDADTAMCKVGELTYFCVYTSDDYGDPERGCR